MIGKKKERKERRIKTKQTGREMTEKKVTRERKGRKRETIRSTDASYGWRGRRKNL